MAQSKFLDPTRKDVLDKLIALHPEAGSCPPPLPQDAPFHSVTNDVKFRKFVKYKMCRGQAPGPSGWTGEMLLPLQLFPNVSLFHNSVPIF